MRKLFAGLTGQSEGAPTHGNKSLAIMHGFGLQTKQEAMALYQSSARQSLYLDIAEQLGNKQ